MLKDSSCSYGYHCDDGGKYESRFYPSEPVLYHEVWDIGDTVGAGFDPERSTMFFTKNGKWICECSFLSSGLRLWGWLLTEVL